MQRRVSTAELQQVIPLEPVRAPEPNRQSAHAVARIQILGPMRATSYLGSDILPRGRKARAILGCLCVASGKRLARSRLAAMLWDRVPEFQARASFRQSFRELVVAFGPLADELISADRETIALKTADCWIDALAVLAPEFAQGAHRSELAAYCQGDLLEELDGISVAFDHWLLSERTRFVEQRRALLEHELSHARGDNAAANERAEIARRLIMFDPTHEGASRVLMRALADMGERAQALREFARCREALKAALDVEPSLETVALYEAIRMFSGPDKDEPALPPPTPRKRNPKAKMPEPNRNRLRVGVLPFLATGPLGNDGLALSLSQEIGAGLARFRWFDVISPMALMHRPPLAADQRGILASERTRLCDRRRDIPGRREVSDQCPPARSDEIRKPGVERALRAWRQRALPARRSGGARSSGASIRSFCSSRGSRSGVTRPARPV